MLKDMFHSENPTKMDRTTLLRYIYFTASKYGWEYPDMDEYEQRASMVTTTYRYCFDAAAPSGRAFTRYRCPIQML